MDNAAEGFWHPQVTSTAADTSSGVLHRWMVWAPPGRVWNKLVLRCSRTSTHVPTARLSVRAVID